jgi:phosphoribosyl 1,2-cyclic phosphodiesterase
LNRLFILASGSEGNCALLQFGDNSIVLDAGLPIKHLQRRLGLLRGPRGKVRAVLITHGHIDHVKHAAAYSRYFGCPLVMSAEAAKDSMETYLRTAIAVRTFEPPDQFLWHGLSVQATPVPHSPGSVAYSVRGTKRVCWISDCGTPTDGTRKMARESDILVVESNYSTSVLAQCAEYHDALKKRIAGDFGHLSNEQAAELISTAVAAGRTKKVVLIHLSEHSNFPELALETATRAADGKAEAIVARHDGVTLVDLDKMGEPKESVPYADWAPRGAL